MWFLPFKVLSKYAWFLELTGHRDKGRTIQIPIPQARGHVTFHEVFCGPALSLLMGKTDCDRAEVCEVSMNYRVFTVTLGPPVSPVFN